MTSLNLNNRLNVRTLRKECPDWEWTPVQVGFGRWTYIGRKSTRWDGRWTEKVEVHAVSMMAGEDEFYTEWCVLSDDFPEMTYLTWLLSQALHAVLDRSSRAGV